MKVYSQTWTVYHRHGLFTELSCTITNANISKTLINVRGTAEIRLLDSKASKRKKVYAKRCLCLTVKEMWYQYKNWGQQKMKLSLVGLQKSELKENRFSFGERDNLFIWKSIDSGDTSEQCSLASGDPLSLRHKRLGRNFFENIYQLKDHAEGLNLSEHELTSCEKCQLNRSKQHPVPK